MPRGNEDRLSNMFFLVYGKPKLKKTWWALKAAEAGFNVHLFDGDKGGGIVKQLSAKARERVNIINCFDKQHRPVFSEFLVRFMQNERILWDDTDDKYVPVGVDFDPTHSHFLINSSALTTNDVIIVDSMRALIFSMLWHHLNDNNVKVEELDKQDWDAYYVQKTLLETFFTRLRGCPAHVVFIAHEMVNELTEPGKDDKGKPIRKATGEVVTQPLGSSRAQGNIMAGYFDDVLYFDIKGSNIYIDTQPQENRQAGGRTFYGRELWQNFTFANYAQANGFQGNWEIPSTGIIYYPPGSTDKRPGVVSKTDKIEIKKSNNPLMNKLLGGGNGAEPASQATEQATKPVQQTNPIMLKIRGDTK